MPEELEHDETVVEAETPGKIIPSFLNPEEPFTFICYARKDEDFVLQLASELKAKGVAVWLDQWNIPAAADWDLEIDNALNSCHYFLIVLSPTSVKSREVRGELRIGLDSRKKIIPILYQSCEIPRSLRLIQYIDFTSGIKNEDNRIEKILRILNNNDLPARKNEVPQTDESIQSDDDTQTQNSNDNFNFLGFIKYPKPQRLTDKSKKQEQYFAYAFTLVFITAIFIPAIFPPEYIPFQYGVFKLILALAAAGIAAFIPGFLAVPVSTIARAGAAIAMLVIVFFVNPVDFIRKQPAGSDISSNNSTLNAGSSENRTTLDNAAVNTNNSNTEFNAANANPGNDGNVTANTEKQFSQNTIEYPVDAKYGVNAQQQCPFEGTDEIRLACCLIRPVLRGGIPGLTPVALPKVLNDLIGKPMDVDPAKLRQFLVDNGIHENSVGGAIMQDVTKARFFVIHDTGSPEISAATFPANINQADWSGNNLTNWVNSAALTHVLVNRVGESLMKTNFAAPVRATKFEQGRDVVDAAVQAQARARRSGMFVHIELVQPRRRSNPNSPVFDVAPTPGFTPKQLDRLALLYVAASVRSKRWLLPAFHLAVDTPIADAHDDPQNFDMEIWLGSVKTLLDKLRQ
jgi:hypothetical protein